MKRFFTISAISAILSLAGIIKGEAQNIQALYDTGRNCATTTLEMFRPDGGGSTYFFVDFDYAPRASEPTGRFRAS